MAKIGDIIRKLIMSNPKTGMWFLSHMPASFWEKQGRKKALVIFYEAVKKVPAYRKFLKEKGVNPAQIKTFEDFREKVPLTDKENYILKYSLKELCWEGELNKMYTIYTSSGSTGEPNFWPRLPQQDLFLPKYWKLFFIQNWGIDKKSTLFVVTMALGNWIAGELVSSITKRLAIEGKYNFTVATPGSDINQILTIIKGLGEYYEQIILVAYPSLVKSILEKGKELGINWKKLNIKFWLGGESFAQSWYKFIIQEIIGNGKPTLDMFVNVYGTADVGGIGFGSPLVNIITKIAMEDEKLFKTLFGETLQFPSLVQVNPLVYFVEEIENEIVVTYKGGIPLIRYNLLDQGKIWSYSEMIEIIKEHGYDVINLLFQEGYPQEKIWKWPFLYIKGRTGNVISIIGANVYPENIEAALYTEETKEINSFRLKVDTDKEGNTHFYILVELKKGIYPSPEKKQQLEKKYHDIFLNKLLEVNTDYKKSFEEDRKTADPIIKIYRFGEGPFAKKLATKEIYIEN
jgi:phenylacetate-CoA ligase